MGNTKDKEALLKAIVLRTKELEENVNKLKKQVDILPDSEKTKSKEFLAYVFSRGILDDVNEFLYMFKSKRKVRYQEFVIRNMIEHTIEYLYLCKNTNLIPEYFGEKIKEKIDINKVTRENVAKEYRLIGQDRYENSRASVRKMANDIGEEKATEGIPCLYDLYCITSENCHNSYFQEIVDENSIIDVDDDRFNLNIVCVILIKFMNSENDQQERG